MLTVARTLAASAPDGSNDLLNYGVLGILAFILLGYAFRQSKRDQDRAEAAEARERAANEARLADRQQYAETLLELAPLLRDAAASVARSNDVINSLVGHALHQTPSGPSRPRARRPSK